MGGRASVFIGFRACRVFVGFRVWALVCIEFSSRV